MHIPLKEIRKLRIPTFKNKGIFKSDILLHPFVISRIPNKNEVIVVEVVLVKQTFLKNDVDCIISEIMAKTITNPATFKTTVMASSILSDNAFENDGGEEVLFLCIDVVLL